MSTRIGKIEAITFGLGGYQDACIGLHAVLSGKAWGVHSNLSVWDPNLIKHTEHCKWTEEDRNNDYVEIVQRISNLLSDAKVSSLDNLVGKPVEATFEDNTLVSWRILTEAI